MPEGYPVTTQDGLAVKWPGWGEWCAGQGHGHGGQDTKLREGRKGSLGDDKFRFSLHGVQNHWRVSDR